MLLSVTPPLSLVGWYTPLYSSCTCRLCSRCNRWTHTRRCFCPYSLTRTSCWLLHDVVYTRCAAIVHTVRCAYDITILVIAYAAVLMTVCKFTNTPMWSAVASHTRRCAAIAHSAHDVTILGYRNIHRCAHDRSVHSCTSTCCTHTPILSSVT